MMEGVDFDTFLSRIYPKVKAIAHKLDRGLVSLDAADLAQEAVVFLWQGYMNGGLRDKTDSYVLQGCYFHLQNFIRTSKDRIKRVAIDGKEEGRDPMETISLVPAGGPVDFIEELDSRLVAEIIRNNGLTEKEKQLLPLLAEGLTTRQIGGKIGLSHVRVVKMRQAIAGKCRKYLDLHIP